MPNLTTLGGQAKSPRLPMVPPTAAHCSKHPTPFSVTPLLSFSHARLPPCPVDHPPFKKNPPPLSKGWGTFLSQPQSMLPTDRPIPRYSASMLASSLEAAETLIRSLLRR